MVNSSPLASPLSMVAALKAPPSKSDVLSWLAQWDLLDENYGPGHRASLEQALLKTIGQGGREGFRSAWTVALLVEGKKWKAEGLEVALLSLLQVAPDGGTQRELIRSMLGLVLSANGIQFLLDWAVEVVHLPSCPMAFGQQSLRIIERAIQRLDKGPIQSDKRVVPALQCVRQSSNFKGHHKKKAALLMARLS